MLLQPATAGNFLENLGRYPLTPPRAEWIFGLWPLISHKQCEITTKLPLIESRTRPFERYQICWLPVTMRGQTKVNHFRFGTFWRFMVTAGHRRCHQTIFRMRCPVRYDKKHTLNLEKFWLYSVTIRVYPSRYLSGRMSTPHTFTLFVSRVRLWLVGTAFAGRFPALSCVLG